MNLFIGCTAKTNIDKVYIDECSDLIKMIARLGNVDLVYGAYNRGLMGLCYSDFKDKEMPKIKRLSKLNKIVTPYFEKEKSSRE